MGIENHPSTRGGNPYLPHSLRGTSNVIPFRRKNTAPAIDTVGGVPVGTSVQIQEWVGDDAERAQLAWKQEKKQERPRVTLLNHLHTILKRKGAVPAEGEPAPQRELEAAPISEAVLDEVVVDEDPQDEGEDPLVGLVISEEVGVLERHGADS